VSMETQGSDFEAQGLRKAPAWKADWPSVLSAPCMWGLQPSSRTLAKASMMRSTWSPLSKLAFLRSRYAGRALCQETEPTNIDNVV
jgi:hypothetical protein